MQQLTVYIAHVWPSLNSLIGFPPPPPQKKRLSQKWVMFQSFEAVSYCRLLCSFVNANTIYWIFRWSKKKQKWNEEKIAATISNWDAALILIKKASDKNDYKEHLNKNIKTNLVGGGGGRLLLRQYEFKSHWSLQNCTWKEQINKKRPAHIIRITAKYDWQEP